MLHCHQFSVVNGAKTQWLEKGASSPGAAQDIARNIYRSIGFPEPLTYVFQSPLAALLAIPHLYAVHGKKPAFVDLLEAMAGRHGGADQVNERLRIGGQMADAFSRPLNAQLCPEFLNSFTDRLCGILRDLGGEPLVSERLAAGFFVEKAIDRSWWEKIRGSQVWWWPFQEFMVFAERPVELHVESSRGLNRQDGPAAVFADGYKIYAVSGIPVSERVIMRPETITIDEIMAENNGEVRRVLVMKMGPGKYLKESGAKLVDMDSLTLVGSAPRALMVDKFGQKWLVGTDGSTARVYSMAVPEHVNTCKQAHDAIAGFPETHIIAEA